MRYYIATSLENIAAAQRLHVLLKAVGHAPTYDWTTHGPVYRADANWERNRLAMRDIAATELRAVLDADAVIVLLPGGRGTHIELGAAMTCQILSTRKRPKIIIAGVHEAWPNLVGEVPPDGPSHCAFHYAQGVEQIAGHSERELFENIIIKLKGAGR